MRRASTEPGSALLMLKVSRLSFSLLCTSGLGGRGILLNEISFTLGFDSSWNNCEGLKTLFPYEVRLESGSSCKECSFDEKGELLKAFLPVLKGSFFLSATTVLLDFQDGCCDASGWNVSELHC